MSTDKVEFLENEYGKHVILKGEWQEHYAVLFNKENVKSLELNYGKGWKGNNIDFLEALDGLLNFTIIDLKIKSIEPLHHLKNLRRLEVITYSKTPINFHNFKSLESCSLTWHNGNESLFHSNNLTKLFIDKYDQKNCDAFKELIHLKSLTLLNAPIVDLSGLASLQKLEHMRIGNLKDISLIDAIGQSTELRELEIQKCNKIRSIKPLSNLKKIQRISLIDLEDIESLKPLKDLIHLNTLLFYGTTNILDGDLSFLMNLKQLSTVSFQNRNHYNKKREIFKKK